MTDADAALSKKLAEEATKISTALDQEVVDRKADTETVNAALGNLTNADATLSKKLAEEATKISTALDQEVVDRKQQVAAAVEECTIHFGCIPSAALHHSFVVIRSINVITHTATHKMALCAESASRGGEFDTMKCKLTKAMLCAPPCAMAPRSAPCILDALRTRCNCSSTTAAQLLTAFIVGMNGVSVR